MSLLDARISGPILALCPATAIADTPRSVDRGSFCTPSCSSSSSLQQWDRGALRNSGSLCSRTRSSASTVFRGENWLLCAQVGRSKRLVDVLCYCRIAVEPTGSWGGDELFLERFVIPIRAGSKLRVSANAGVASVSAEGENAGVTAEESTQGKAKPSGQLARWARARKIRAGKLTTQKKNESISSVPVQEPAEPSHVEKDGLRQVDDDNDIGNHYGAPRSPGVDEKCVYMVSDGTGWTADHSVHAALGQFEHCMVDQRCAVNTHLFSDVNDVDRLLEIIRQAGLEGGMVVYTLADPVMADVAKQACELLRIPHIDILGPITEALANHLGVSPLGLPRGAPGRKGTLSKQYFKRIEAVEFTIKQDDGALPKNLRLADLVLVGVSRTSKTPLSTYIAQKGYKVANVPLVLGIDPPKELFEIHPDKVFGLTINANFLKAIRLARYRQLGVTENSQSSYSDMEHIRRELDYSRKLFSQNPRWPVIEVTGKAIEETAAVILRLYHERRNKFSMPRISTRY